MKTILALLAFTIFSLFLSFNSFSQGMIQVDSSRLIVQALDSNNKETGYISYYVASDRYTTRGTVKQAVKKMYNFILMELELASVTLLMMQCLNDDGSINNQTAYNYAVQRMRVMKQKHGL